MSTPRPPDVADVAGTAGAAGFAASIEAAATALPLPLVRVADIADPGPTKWLIDQLWTSAAFGIVGAEPKSWKSWLTLYFGICVSSGTRAFNRYDVQQGSVLVFSAEGGKGLLRSRSAAMCNAMDIAIPPELYAIDLPTLRLDDPAVASKVIQTVDSVRPALLILDPLRELHGGDENDAATISALLGPLRQLQQTGCACMVVHHLGKRNESRGRGPQRGGQRLRGSSAIHGATDSALYLETTGEGEEKRVTVMAEHRAAAEPPAFTLALRKRSMPDTAIWLEIVDEKDEEVARQTEKAVAGRDKKRKAIVRAVELACMPGRDPLRNATAIFNVVKGKRAEVFRLVKELLEENAIYQAEGGAFRMMPEGGTGAIRV